MSASRTESDVKLVFDFTEGSAEMRALLGGKGANLAEMTHVLGADSIPGGFTITTEACTAYSEAGGLPDGLWEEIRAAVSRLEAATGQRFGGDDDPLLLSVRSGAPVSMPGMLDTVLNLGLGAGSVEALSAASGSPAFAWDSFRRLVQMYSEVVCGVPAELFEEALAEAREETGSATDADLSEEALRGLTEQFLRIFEEHTGDAFPTDPGEQLTGAVEAVFRSWNNERAVAYRRFEGIPDELGTAVTVQRMVYGNLGTDSGSGVAFTRDPATGASEPEGDFLLNAQGEDVVAGVRNTENLADLARRMPEAHAELIDALRRLERHYRDMQDVEYTIERGRLYILQTRDARRPAQAAVRFAFDAVAEGLLDREQALETIDPGSLDALLHPIFDPEQTYTELTRAVPAAPGAAKGAIVFTAEEAGRRGADGEDVILVRPFTSANDVAGFHAARGVLTSRGGKSSHAAIVARGMGRPCVCGAADLEIDLEAGTLRIGDRDLRAGDEIAIDGSSGAVTADAMQLIKPSLGEDFAAVLGWADEIRGLGVMANADTPEDAARARELGAEGIGLCRTEHMFFGSDRDELVTEMFIAGELWRRAREQGGPHAGAESRDGLAAAREEFDRALDGLLEMQRSDFTEIFRAMSGLPVTIRLLDPPIHEFISIENFEREVEVAERDGDTGALGRASTRLAVARDLQETNPMLGTRGARLGLLLPPLYEMQVTAILEAAASIAAEGEAPKVEIMIPLIAFERELAELRELVDRRAGEVLGDTGIEYSVGTMLELPRACLLAGDLAADADFFSFGTNDLTQTTIGLSRDDAEGSFLPDYLERRILVHSPFASIDVEGVGELVRIAVERGRAVSADLRLGVCGEHGGDPASIRFFASAGLDYVSCSPFRVPIARVAAAQAAIEGARSEPAPD